MISAYQTLVDRLKAYGIHPKLHILDNKCSDEFKKQIKTNNMDYQLVPPHGERRNIAGKSSSNFQGPFCCSLVWNGCKIPHAAMASNLTAGGT